MSRSLSSASLLEVMIDEAFAMALRHQQAGQLAEAEAGYRQILAYDENQPEVHYNLGLVLRNRGQLESAVTAYERAMELNPRFPEAINNLGETLGSLGRLDEAEDIFRHALLLTPDSGDTWNNLGGVLKDLGRSDEAIACLRRAVQLQPDNPRVHSNLLFTLHYCPTQDPHALLHAAQEWNQKHAAPFSEPLRGNERVADDRTDLQAGTLPRNESAPAAREKTRTEPALHPFQAHRSDSGPHGQPSANLDCSPDRRLRIGYVSAYFRDHCQALFTSPLFSRHDHAGFEIFGYSDVPAPDATTARLQSCTDHWRQTDKLNDAQLAEQIREDKIDILVDLTLHMAAHRLLVFARKPAPVLVTWLGYPGTTGMSAIDYRLTDPTLDPPGADDSLYAERSFRLPDCFWCYDPLTDRPTVNQLPAGPTGPLTFGCLNNFCKVNDATLELWARVLNAAPHSKLLMLAPPGAARARIKSKLRLTSERVEFVAHQPRADYLKEYHRIDLCLDTFPYNGHTTSLDALWMGVPVVSLCGPTVVSRAGLSLMTNLGLPELVGHDPAHFVRLAIDLAQDRPRLAALRSSLRTRLTQSPLTNAAGFARNIERAYRTMWQAWCAEQKPTEP